MTFGRTTGTPRMSAWNCMRVSFLTMPPSTFSSVSSTPSEAASAIAASSTSRDWKAVASSTARAMWFLLWKRVMPTITPRASERQCGANRPENAGTTNSPPLSSTCVARSSISGASLIRPRLSRIHCTSEPVTATEPSRA